MPDLFEKSPETNSFNISLSHEERCDVLVLGGDMEPEAAGRLREELVRLGGGPRSVEIDWSGAEYMPPQAVQVLLAFRAALGSSGLELRIRHDNPRVRSFLEVAGLSDCLKEVPK